MAQGERQQRQGKAAQGGQSCSETAGFILLAQRNFFQAVQVSDAPVLRTNFYV